MKTPGDRIDTIEKDLGTLTIKALSLKLALSKGEFREEDHPRADDGKFGSGSGSGKKEDTRSSENDGKNESNGDKSGGAKDDGTISGKGGAGHVPEIEYITNEKGVKEPLISKPGLRNMGADFKEAGIKSPLSDPTEETLAATTKALNGASFSDRYRTLYSVTKQFHQKATEDQIKKLGEKGIYFVRGTRETLGDGIEHTLNIWGLSIKTKGD